MSAVSRRPESRTKEELKRELKKSGVEFPHNATKDELVRLFREQKFGRSAIELSSDEEGSRSPARRRKVRVGALVLCSVACGWGLRIGARDCGCTCSKRKQAMGRAVAAQALIGINVVSW